MNIDSRFNKQDFLCRCGCGRGKFDSRLFILLNFLADAGYNFTLNSAFRCEAHNANTPGASPHSLHCRGLAVDIGFDINNNELLADITSLVVGDLQLYHINEPYGMHIDLRSMGNICFDIIPYLS